jgi:carbonic anhydrase/acetyltransferase-like protein (isoleucine patch superfamily)
MILEAVSDGATMNNTTFIHERAVILGDVTIGNNSSIWPGAVIRADFNAIVVGDYTSIQDNAVLHATPALRTTVGNYVTVGHCAVLHGCSIGDNVIVGMNSTVLDNARVGSNCIIAGGCVVPPGMQIPEGSLVLGVPAVIREGKADKNAIMQSALVYFELSRRYLSGKDRFILPEVIEAMKKYQ